MSTIVLVSLILGLGVSAYRQARRAGVWSWRSFLLTAGSLGLIGITVGFAAVQAGRRTGGQHAAEIALTAGALIVTVVFVLALAWKRRSRRP